MRKGSHTTDGARAKMSASRKGMAHAARYKVKVCQLCGKEYQPTSPPQQYCAECGLAVRAEKKKVSAAKRRAAKWPMPHLDGPRVYKTKACQVCGKDYQPASPTQKYCAECGPVAKVEKSRVGDVKYRKENSEKRKVSAAKYREENSEKIKEYGRSEKHKVGMANWVKMHPEKVAVIRSKRRALKYANTPLAEMLMSTEWLVVLAAAAGLCHYCHKEAKLTIDHVIPLSRGGKDSKDNVVAACLRCNTSKGNKTLEEWRPFRFADLPQPGHKIRASVRGTETSDCSHNKNQGRLHLLPPAAVPGTLG
jgi:5-methylcytosine-specific restriction endonuclease McrA